MVISHMKNVNRRADWNKIEGRIDDKTVREILTKTDQSRN